VPGFVAAVAVFAVTQAILSLSILKLPHRYVPLFLGGSGLVSTIVALILASTSTHGLTVDGTAASWLATTVVVWLVTTIAAITLPRAAHRRPAGPARRRRRHTADGQLSAVVRVEILHFGRVAVRKKFDV
jgi:hypothetical protein